MTQWRLLQVVIRPTFTGTWSMQWAYLTDDGDRPHVIQVPVECAVVVNTEQP